VRKSVRDPAGAEPVSGVGEWNQWYCVGDRVVCTAEGAVIANCQVHSKRRSEKRKAGWIHSRLKKSHVYLKLPFAKLRKATFTFVIFVCLSYRMEKLGSNWKDFYEI
jgi:hypothetical protein